MTLNGPSTLTPEERLDAHHRGQREYYRRIKHRRITGAHQSRGIERGRLSDEQLRHFVEPLTWPGIFALVPKHSKAWWRGAVLDADEYGRGLLEWVPAREAWRLSQRGRDELGISRSEP